MRKELQDYNQDPSALCFGDRAYTGLAALIGMGTRSRHLVLRESLMTKENKKARKEVERMIRLLRIITEGQGSVNVNVMDCGAGGGFSKGTMHVEWMRDGDFCQITSYTKRDFVDSIMRMMNEKTDGLIIEMLDARRKHG